MISISIPSQLALHLRDGTDVGFILDSGDLGTYAASHGWTGFIGQVTLDEGLPGISHASPGPGHDGSGYKKPRHNGGLFGGRANRDNVDENVAIGLDGRHTTHSIWAHTSEPA
jgi:hypothetical protein